MAAAADDCGAVEAAEDAGEGRMRLRAQVVAVEDERQRVVGETVASTQGQSLARLGLDDAEAGHGLTWPAGELGGAPPPGRSR